MIGGHFTRVTSHTYTLACILRWKKLKSKVFPLLFSFSTICENEFVITLLQFFGDLSSHGVDWLFLYFNNKAKAAL